MTTYRVPLLFFLRFLREHIMAHENSSKRFRRRICGLWSICLLLCTTGCRGETVIDTCAFVHDRQIERHSVSMQSHNVVVESDNPETFAGDNGRFKRTNAEQGYITYASPRGFERLKITGYVFGLLPQDSWSLSVRIGDATSPVNNTFDVLTMTRENFSKYKTMGNDSDWQQFVIDLSLNVQCPPRVTVLLQGAASNNEYPGCVHLPSVPFFTVLCLRGRWGVQVGRVMLVQSWYDECTAPCTFQNSSCSADIPVQRVDPVKDFRYVFFKESTLEIDSSNAGVYFGGDGSRIKRSNNETAGLVYSSTRSIRSVEIELFQYRPFDTDIIVQPFISESCRPITLTPSYDSSTKRPGGWQQRIAHIDLSGLPLCTKRLAINISGGQHGWEMQISRVTFNLVGEFETNRAYAPRSDDASSDGDTWKTWWIWLTVLLGAAFIFLLLAMIIRRVALCFGDDETSVYHISNFPYFKRRRQNPPGVPDTPVIYQETNGSRPHPAADPSFSFARVP